MEKDVRNNIKIRSRIIYIVTSIIMFVVIFCFVYRKVWSYTKDIFFENRDKYHLRSRDIDMNISNYKNYEWVGGYHGYSDPFYYGTLNFLSDSLVKYSYGLYDGSSWDFPLRYLLKIPFNKQIDTFQVVEDTVILYKGYIYDNISKKEYKATAIDIFEIDGDNLIFSPVSSFVYPDSLNKKYMQMHNR